MRSNIVSFIVVYFSFLSACTARDEPDSCTNRWSQSNKLSVDISRSSVVSPESISGATIRSIESCFGDHKYNGKSVNFNRYDVRLLKGGQTVIIFGVGGAPDVDLGVLLSTSGRIKEAGWTSLNY